MLIQTWSDDYQCLLVFQFSVQCCSLCFLFCWYAVFSVSCRTAPGMAEIRTLTVTHVQSPWSLWQCWEGQWRTCVRKRPGKHWWTQLVATIVSHGRVKTIEWECLSFCKAHLNSASNEFSQGTSPKKWNISKPSVKMKVSSRLRFQYPTEESQFSDMLEL